MLVESEPLREIAGARPHCHPNGRGGRGRETAATQRRSGWFTSTGSTGRDGRACRVEPAALSGHGPAAAAAAAHSGLGTNAITRFR